MSKASNKISENNTSRKQRARAASVVGQFLAIKAALQAAEAGGDEIDDIDEVAAQLTVAAYKPIKRS
jgi:hypothetical protein